MTEFKKAWRWYHQLQKTRASRLIRFSATLIFLDSNWIKTNNLTWKLQTGLIPFFFYFLFFKAPPGTNQHCNKNQAAASGPGRQSPHLQKPLLILGAQVKTSLEPFRRSVCLKTSSQNLCFTDLQILKVTMITKAGAHDISNIHQQNIKHNLAIIW